MQVRCFWRACTFRDKTWGAPPIDAFWVEATEQEARASVFPLIKPEQITESRQLAEQFGAVAAAIGNPARPFCFLVARDRSSIDPFQPHYPVHQMWNAYSPFEPMPEIFVATLDALCTVVLPTIVTCTDSDADRDVNTDTDIA